ncbi:MAG: hypothetical protein WBP84_08685 [Nitrososphaeraceae archaeon]|jgi:hypothetical protein
MVADKRQYEMIVQQVETGSTAKKYFRDLWGKLIGKSQDQIIELITSGGKQYAPIGIVIALRLIGIVIQYRQ